jgi:demethylphylloquinone reductase
MDPVKICILGGGFGGLYTALHLNRLTARSSRKYQITLIDNKDRFLFTPLLYELVTDEISAWEIAPDFSRLLQGTEIEFCQGKIQNVDLALTLDYDYLVLAVGQESNFQAVPGASTHGWTFRHLADVDRLKLALQQLKQSKANRGEQIQIAVIGGGLNGIELSCKLADLLQASAQIVLIDRGKEILTDFPNQIRSSVKSTLIEHHIQLKLATTISSIDFDRLTIIDRDRLEIIPIDLAIWTAGTQSMQWIKNLKCSHNHRGQPYTLPTLQLANYPEVFALGDVAAIYDRRGRQLPATAQAAFQQANCAARNIWARQSGRRLRHFRYLYLGEMLTLGIDSALVYSFGIQFQGSLAASIRRLVYCQRLPTLRHRRQLIQYWLKRQLNNFFPR